MTLKIDVHIHLAGTGCCGSGIRLADNFRKRYTFRLIRMLQGISDHQMHSTIDHDWAKRIANYVATSELDYGVVLGFDAAYQFQGGKEVAAHTQMVIPSRWVFEICHEFPGLLPGPSINPFRADVLDELDYCIDQGAVLIKWLPSAQDINPSAPAVGSFYQKLAAANIPLLVHMGGERTFRTINDDYSRVHHLRPALEQGVTVICAHTATRIVGSSELDQQKELKRLLATYPNLYVDNSGLCNPGRFSHAPKLAVDPEITSRTLYGSDWPVPSNAFYYAAQLGPIQTWRLERTKNPLDRDVRIKRALGFPEDTLSRANQVLANLGRWTSRPSP